MFAKVVIGAEYTSNVSESNENSVHPSPEIVANLDCPIKIIQDFIQQSFNLNAKSEFDLCDENGNLAFINEKEPWSNGANCLTPKITYFVVFFERNLENNFTNPILHLPESFRKNSSHLNEMMTKIKKQINPSFNEKPSRTSKTRMCISNYSK